MTVSLPNPIPLRAIEEARKNIDGLALRTPLIRLHVDAPAELYLKLECLQPIGSFKIRGAANAMAQLTPQQLQQGVWTASAGNMAQGVAWCARERGVTCTVAVPEHAPEAKLAAIDRLGAKIVKLPFNDWWQILVSHGAPGFHGTFIHPVSDQHVMAGNGTAGLEIAEDLPDVAAVVVPYGGGGLSCGIASALRGTAPNAKVFAAEVATAAPLAPSLAAGKPLAIEYTPSFVDGIGGRNVLAEIWPLAATLLAGSIVVEVSEVARAVRVLMERARVVAEGAGASGVAAALTGRAGGGKVVCVVSGGNIDMSKVAIILAETAS